MLDNRTLPSDLTSRVLYMPGELGTNPLERLVVVTAETSHYDVTLRVFAPGLTDADRQTIVRMLNKHIRLALVGLNFDWVHRVGFSLRDSVVTVHVGDTADSLRTKSLDLVLAVVPSIIQPLPECYWQTVHVLRSGQSLVLVDWEEPESSSAYQLTLTFPPGLGFSRPEYPKTDRLEELIKALLGHEFYASVGLNYRSSGALEVILTFDPRYGRPRPAVGAEMFRRIIFAAGTQAKLAGINSSPVMVLSSPFTPWVDNGE